MRFFAFMASSNGPKVDAQRPRPIQNSKSFSKLEPLSPDRVTRSSRANTIQNGAIPTDVMSNETNVSDQQKSERRLDTSGKNSPAVKPGTGQDAEKLPVDSDELPIELVSLTDSFIDSLSAKVHPTPPSVDKLSNLFQDFYAVAANHINTHISALSSRQHRKHSESSPSSSVSSLSLTASKFRAKAASLSKDTPRAPERRDSEQQMLTTEEIAERKRARKALEHKRVALEEAVERRVCEGIYDRIWRHRSTQDEAQDEKLRSKTAALSVVGIGLTDLGIDLGQESDEDSDANGKKEKEVREWLQEARDQLIAMNEERYPLGKLHHLKAAHKSIVDTLSHFHPSSSADEIMPMLIYTLITSRPEGIDVISNLYFIQRFRNENKIDGEAAYCLTNLEAAITFLETVDLASLRADEVPSGPAKSSSRPTTPKSERNEPLTLTTSAALSAPTVNTASVSPTILKPSASPSLLRPHSQLHNRRLSELFQPPAALGAAGDAVLNTADQGLKTIGNSLGDSYKFLVGKLKERQEDTSGKASDIIVPKTLDDARKLVSTPPPEDDGSVSGASSLHSPETTERQRSDSGASSKPADKVLSIIGGRAMMRDHSTDSAQSSNSGKKVAFAGEGSNEKAPSPLHAPPTPSNANLANPALVESMRNLGSKFVGGMSFPRGFGRPVLPPATKPVPDGGVAELTTAFPELAASLPPKETPKIAPPIKRFMDLQNPGELRINEVLELLRDYRRLAGALKEAGAF